MNILKILILPILLLFVIGPVNAQLLINTQGQTITLTDSAILTVPASIENLGTIENRGGFVYVSKDWTNTNGVYNAGTGHFIFNGTGVQTINHADQDFYVLSIEGGGNKIVTSDITVLDSLMLANGIVDLSTNTMILTAEAKVAGGSVNSYIQGAMERTGNGDLFYPIGKNGTYAPAELLDVQGSNPRLRLEVFETNPLGIADSGLTAVSGLRYWKRTTVSGTFEKSKVKLPLINETIVSSITKAVVAGGELSSDFKNYGRTKATGTNTDGSIESSNYLSTGILAIGGELNENRVADSTALVSIYDQAQGNSWTSNTNWKSSTAAMDTWFGVTISNDRVVGLSLPNNNLKGNLSDAIRLLSELKILDLSDNELVGEVNSSFTELLKLTTVDLSENQFTSLPDLTGMSGITTIDVSNNSLPFSTLIPNVSVSGIVYAPQDTIGNKKKTSVREGNDFTTSIVVDDAGNSYQWYKDGVIQPGLTGPSITITSPGFTNMGAYTAEITNAKVPGLSIITAPDQLEVLSDLGGVVQLASDNSVFSAGDIVLFAEGSFGFDTIQAKSLGTNGDFEFTDVVLGDYYLKVIPTGDDTVFMSTYYESTILSEQATVINFRTITSDLTLLELQRPSKFKPEEGNNVVDGFLEIEEEFLIDAQARIEARRRVRLAGVSLYRSKSRNSRKSAEDIDLTDWDLVAYTQTNDNGEFKFDNVPDGIYRILIDYPGIPIASGSEIEFTLSEAEDQTDITFEAAIDDPEVGIVVKEVNVTHSKYDLIESMLIYPNPAGDFLTLVLDSRKDYEVRLSIVDIQGMEVLSRSITRNETPNDRLVLDVSRILPGVYMVVLSDPVGDEGPLKYAKLMITR